MVRAGEVTRCAIGPQHNELFPIAQYVQQGDPTRGVREPDYSNCAIREEVLQFGSAKSAFGNKNPSTVVQLDGVGGQESGPLGVGGNLDGGAIFEGNRSITIRDGKLQLAALDRAANHCRALAMYADVCG